jgi:hypothetical protein
MKYFLSFLLMAFATITFGQNLISPITITLPANPPANTADWASALPPVMIMAQTKMENGYINGDVQESAILVTIKSGGKKVCGSYTPNNAPQSGFNTISKNWTGASVLALLGQECVLQPGSYELCVQFLSMTSAKVLGESCKPFTIADAKNVSYSPPNNVMPADNKEFTEKEINAPITFRWTPLVPKPHVPVEYRLRVWQLMAEKGNTSAKALKTTEPIFEKDVDNVTQLAERIVWPKSCPGCKYYWSVEAFMKSGNGGDLKSLGMSAPTSFSVANKSMQTCNFRVTIDSIFCKGICYNGKMRYFVKLKLENTGNIDLDFENANNYNVQMTQPAYVSALANVTNGNKLVFAWTLNANGFGSHNSNIIVDGAQGSGSRPAIIAANTIEYSDYEICTDATTTMPITLKVFVSSNGINNCASEVKINSLPICPLFCCDNIWISKEWYKGPRIKLDGSLASLSSLDSTKYKVGRFDSLGAFPCNSKIGFKLNYNCNSNCGIAGISYIIFQPTATAFNIISSVNFPNGVNTDIVLPSIAGDYIIVIRPICGDTCRDKSLSYKFKIVCPIIDSTPTCCTNSKWNSKWQYINNVREPMPECNSYLGEFKCKQERKFTASFACAQGCNTQIVYEIRSEDGKYISGVKVGNKIDATIITPSTSGKYQLGMYAICGKDTYGNCNYTFSVDCPNNDCCKGGNWVVKGYTLSSPNSKIAPIAINCGQKYIVECIKGGSISFNASYSCNSACGTKVYVKINDVDGEEMFNKPVPQGFDLINSGTYLVTYYAKCGDKICDSCTFKIIIKSCEQPIDCCLNGSWEKCSFPGLTLSSGKCPKPNDKPETFIINAPAVFNYSYSCNGQNSNLCAAKLKYVITTEKGVVVVPGQTQASGADAELTMPSSAGNYCLKVFALCGESKTPCDSCITCFKVVCTDCKDLEIVYETTNTSKFLIGGKITSTKLIKQVTAKLVCFSANRKTLTAANPNPNFEFINTSTINGATVSMPYSLTGTRSNIIISNLTASFISIPFKLVISDDSNKRLKSYYIKFTIFYEDGTYCEYKDIVKTF